MNSIILIKAIGPGQYQCLQCDGHSRELFVDNGERLHAASEHATLIYIAPADTVTLRQVSFEPHERKMLRQRIPFALEEALVDDIDDLHFALGEVVDSSVAVAVVNRATLQQWLDDLQQQEIDVQQIIPELQLLALPTAGWVLQVNEHQWLLRYSQQQGFALEADSAIFAMQLLLDEADELPAVLHVYCDQQQQDQILSQLPTIVQGMVEWHYDDYWSQIETGFRQQQSSSRRAINLRQADYALSLPWQKWWANWRVVAILLLAVTLFQLASTFTTKHVLSSRNLALRTEVEQLYRSVVPRGAIIDPERQLQRKVSAMKGSGGHSFMLLLETVAQQLSAVDGLVLQRLNYTAKQTEIRVTILTNTFDDVETLRQALEERGLRVKLTGSSAQANKTRARLRIRGKDSG